MKEQHIQAKRIKELEAEGYYVIKLTVTNKNGIPDLIAIPPHSGVLFSEVKTKTGRISALQKYRMKELEKHGMKTEVYRGVAMKKTNVEQTNDVIVQKVKEDRMKLEESQQGASPEEILELLHGFMILMEKHKLSALAKEIKDDEAGFNLYSRTEEILKKIYPESAEK